MHIWSGLSRKMDLNRDMRLSQVLFCRQWQWGLYAKEVASVGPTISFSFLLYYVTQDSTLKHPLVSQWKPRISQGLHMFGSTPSHSSHSHGSCGGGGAEIERQKYSPLVFHWKNHWYSPANSLQDPVNCLFMVQAFYSSSLQVFMVPLSWSSVIF